MDLDDMLKELGQFGKYQCFCYALILFPVLMCGYGSLEYVFVTMDVPHRCRVPECEGSSGSVQFSPSWLNIAVPYTAAGEPEKCLRYRVRQNMSSMTHCSADYFDSDVTEHCTDWIFKDSTRTIIHDFKLLCPEDDFKRTVLASYSLLTAFVGFPLIGFITDTLGRKPVLIFGCVILPLLAVCRSVVTDYETFKYTQFLLGLFGGTIYMPCYITGLEILSPQKRLLGSLLINVYFCVGVMLTGAVMWLVQDWRLLLRVGYVPMLGLVSYNWLMPESVRWLYAKGRFSEVEKTFVKIAETNGTRDKLPTVLLHLKEHASSKMTKDHQLEIPEEKEKYTFSLTVLRVLKSPVILFRVFSLCICWTSSLFVYYGLSQDSVSISGNPYLNFILTALVEIPAYIVTLWLPDMKVLGRRWSTAGSFITTAATSSLFHFLEEGSLLHSLLFLGGKFSSTVSLTLLYVYTLEVFPTELRTSLFTVCSTVGRLGSIFVPLIPLLVIDPMILFGAVSVVGGMFVLTCPETMNMTLPDTIEEAENLGTLARDENQQ